ncbi:MAG: hypothetical protein WDO24_19405 [Pseudomonadota bacterium]
MSVSAELKQLIDTAAPFWAGEAEVFRTYWDLPARTRETDRQWLAYQCSKEIWGSGISSTKGIFLGPAEELIAAFPKIDTEIDRHAVLDIAEGLWAEFAHYCAFADAYDALGLPGEPKINPHAVKTSWAEDIALTELRFAHRRDHPKLGMRATRFTEGGYCTLFSEGMALQDRTAGPHGRANALIATACRRVYDDEFGHMLKASSGSTARGSAPPNGAAWPTSRSRSSSSASACAMPNSASRCRRRASRRSSPAPARRSRSITTRPSSPPEPPSHRDILNSSPATS